MSQNFWNVDCSHCGQNLRLTVGDKDLGRTVKAICPKCNSQTLTTIGVPASSSPEIDISPDTVQKVEKLVEKISGDPEVSDLIQSIRDDGFDLLLAIALCKNGMQKKIEVRPKVGKDGEVAAGTFTKEDEDEFLKAFKIKL